MTKTSFMTSCLLFALSLPAWGQKRPDATEANATRPGMHTVPQAADQTAAFPNLSRYISERLVYPETARSCGVEGRVKAALLIESTGKVIDICLTEQLGFGCDEAVVNLFKQMPDWTPAVKNGRPVRQRVIVPVYFRLR